MLFLYPIRRRWEEKAHIRKKKAIIFYLHISIKTTKKRLTEKKKKANPKTLALKQSQQ